MQQTAVQPSLADAVYDLLKEQMLNGTLTGGMHIPEQALARQFGVSRTPIREAIRRLAEYGLVVLTPHSRASVYSVTSKDADDIAQVRITLEYLAIDLATAESITEHIDQMARCAAECHYFLGVGNRSALFESDSKFHHAMVACSGNDHLLEVYDRLDAKVQLLRVANNYSDNELGEVIDHHGKLIRLLRIGDKQACKDLLCTHVMHTGVSEVQ